mgnify:CR=1 FL=1
MNSKNSFQTDFYSIIKSLTYLFIQNDANRLKHPLSSIQNVKLLNMYTRTLHALYYDYRRNDIIIV